MTAAVAGLLIFQGFWVNNVIDVGKKSFKQSVHDVLMAVANNLEQQEVVYTAEQKLKFNQGGKTIIGYDSLRFISRSNDDSVQKSFITEEMIKKLFFDLDTINLGDPQFSLQFDSETPLSLREGQFIDEDVLIEISRSRSEIDTIQALGQNNRSENKVREKSEMVMVVLNELISRERKIENRITKDQIDSMLSAQLKSYGLDLEYGFGVYDEDDKQLIISNSDEYKGALLKSEFKTKLFQADVIDQNNFLLVYFPKQGYYIFKEITAALFASFVLIVIIVFCFAYAIYTIRKQKQVSEIKNDFINNMTHEFKTPISTVSLACEALQDDEIQKNNGFVDRYIKIIRDENSRLGMQVEKVLQMATLDKKDFKLKLETLDLHNVINNAIKNINLQVEKKGGHIQKNYKAEKLEVIADELHLTNIIYNLLDNANKYSPEEPKITIGTENYNGGIIVRVLDEGIGMTKEVMNKIFEKFYRVPTGNLHDVKGFGLGLAYVKTMLDAIGGSINVKSSINKGSEFEIYLPQHGQN